MGRDLQSADDFLIRVLFMGGSAFILYGLFSRFVLPQLPYQMSYILSGVVWVLGATSDFILTHIGLKRRVLVELNPLYNTPHHWRVRIGQICYILVLGLVLIAVSPSLAGNIRILQLLQGVVAFLAMMHLTAFANNLVEMIL